MKILIFVLIAVIIAVILKRDDDSSSGLPGASFPLQPFSMVGEYSASLGSYGRQIADLQEVCSVRFGCKIQVDGMYGPKSEDFFQRCFGRVVFTKEDYDNWMKKYGV